MFTSRVHIPGRFRHWMTMALLALIAAAVWAWPGPPPIVYTQGELPQQAYVWQRRWDAPVRDAVSSQHHHFNRLVVLAAEATLRAGRLAVAHAELDHAAMRALDRPVGLALRIGPHVGSFDADDDVTQSLIDLARQVLADAAMHDLPIAELQLDFDAASSRLAEYKRWVTAIRQAVAPTPVTITALPTWMNHRAFGPLVRATDGYVLQVHSLERPANADAFMTLCDPRLAERWVTQAAGFGVPFRVALPTYGYTVGFDADGTLLGLSAEGPALHWPRDAQQRELWADARDMAGLIKAWTARRPMQMQGVIWYRLPTAADEMNWRWPTLEAVMQGRVPEPKVAVEQRVVEPGLLELLLVNRGDADASAPVTVRVSWQDGRLLASDALAGAQWVQRRANHATLRMPMSEHGADGSIGPRLRAGDRRMIAWLRFDQDMEVHADVQP